jgi:hypothetical protein
MWPRLVSQVYEANDLSANQEVLFPTKLMHLLLAAPEGLPYIQKLVWKLFTGKN